MAAKGQFSIVAYRCRNGKNTAGGMIPLGRAKTNFTSLETAIKTGIPGFIKNRDGGNVVYITGPHPKLPGNEQTHIVTV